MRNNTKKIAKNRNIQIALVERVKQWKCDSQSSIQVGHRLI